MKVLIGVDDSLYSPTGYVARAAWPEATKFLVLSAVAPNFVGGQVEAADAIAQLRKDQEKYHKEIAEGAAHRLRKAGLSVDVRMVVADPRAALLDVAKSEQVDLIVVGSHGRTGIKKLLLGSVASHVVTHAPCSVLVVREEGTQHG